MDRLASPGTDFRTLVLSTKVGSSALVHIAALKQQLCDLGHTSIQLEKGFTGCGALFKGDQVHLMERNEVLGSSEVCHPSPSHLHDPAYMVSRFMGKRLLFPSHRLNC